jgi:hypothetical protein
MSVRELLRVISYGTVVKVYQTPIPRIDASRDPVLRQYADVTTLEKSGQNYLDFKVTELRQDCGIMTIICTASYEQENATVAAFYEGYWGR